MVERRDASTTSPPRRSPSKTSTSRTTTTRCPSSSSQAEGAWVTDVEGSRYLDCLAAYSALNFGHRHPALLAAAQAQLGRVTLTSRAFHNDQLGPFVAALAELCRQGHGAADEHRRRGRRVGIKVARKWGYRVKGVPRGRAKIIVAGRQLPRPHHHDRQLLRRSGCARRLRPVHPRLLSVPYGDAEALAAAIDDEHRRGAGRADPGRGRRRSSRRPTTCRPCARSAREQNVLFIADEIQSGLGRTGSTFACDHVGVVPDLYLLGKALGGGIVPVSAVVGDRDVLGVLQPGRARLDLRRQPAGRGGRPRGGRPAARPASTSARPRARRPAADRLRALIGHGVARGARRRPVGGRRHRPGLATGRSLRGAHGARRAGQGHHGSTIRLAPPLVVKAEELDFAVGQLAAVLEDLPG